MTAAGWHPDPAGSPGRLRWWDGQAWTDHVHEAQPAAAPTNTSPLDAVVLVVSPPRETTPGCRVFELSDGAGARLGRLVETSRGTNDSGLGAALSRARGWQDVTTRELRGPRGYPELILTWGPERPSGAGNTAPERPSGAGSTAPSAPGAIVVTLPDRREVGRLLLGEQGWAVLGHDGRTWGAAGQGGVVAGVGRHLTQVSPDGVGGWRATTQGGPSEEPLRSLLAAASVTADLL